MITGFFRVLKTSIFATAPLLIASVALTAALTAASTAHADTRVSLKSVVEVDSAKTEITLSDLVVAKGLSRTAIEKFRTVRLSDAPKAGESRAFSEAVLEEALRPELDAISVETGEKFELKLPSRVTVSKKKFRIGKEEVQAELQSQFKAQCADCEIQISNLSVPVIGANVPGDTQWALRTRTELPKGSFSIPLEVTSGSRPSQTYWVSGVVTIGKPVPVAAREIAIGERVQPEDLIVLMKDVTYASDVAVTQTELAAGIAARQIAAGQIVFRSMIRRELAVKSGDTVKVSAGSADWQITLDGVSQSSGYVGDVIRVKIPSTQKLVSGLLKEKGVVEIQ